MKHATCIIKKITVVFVLNVVCYMLPVTCTSVSAATIISADAPLTTVSVTVGTPTQQIPKGRFSIYGKTSPLAVVTIQSPISGTAKANSSGDFEFDSLYLTIFHEDICLVARDTNDLTTPPICVPPPSVEDNKRVGPVFIPPSTSISSGNAYIGDTVTLTGQTIPNAEVKLSLFTDDLQQGKKLALIPEANAYTIPSLTLSSNEKGEYSLVLPTASSQYLRMFTRALFEGNSTPKGITLILDIFPLWMILFKFFTNFFSLLRAHIIEIIILAQLYFLLLYVLKRYFDPHAIGLHRHRELAVIHGEITLQPHELMREENKLTRRYSALLMKR